jgi:aminomethyltransferase
MEQLAAYTMKTLLYSEHLALGAKFIDFGGWEMPLHYQQGIIAEHRSVRTAAGIFDVSHMGRIKIEGPEAEALLDFLSTNQIRAKGDNTATYTVWCNSNGGCIDDLIIYRHSAERFFVIVNASNRDGDLAHLQQHAEKFNVTVESCFESEGILAVQGPQAKALVGHLFPEVVDLKPMRLVDAQFNGTPLIVASTGYTGAGGVEIYLPNTIIVEVWRSILQLGAVPIGLGARDTLRLEMGYALYGHELSLAIAPTESVAAWAVKLAREFLGKESLQQLESSSAKRHAWGAVLLQPGIAREHYEVLADGKVVGTVTSGTLSPTLNRAIALLLISGPFKLGDTVQIKIRDRLVDAQLVKPPFLGQDKG